MRQHEARRTLVKSQPELWAECSDASSLARHLDQFGDIRITKLEPETAVAWEGERGSGTVQIEPSGWGTKVILTATSPVEEDSSPVAANEPAATEPESAPDPPPAVALDLSCADEGVPERPARRRRLARLFGRLRGPRAEIEEPAGMPEPMPPPEAVEEPPVISSTEAALTAALDSLGQAHHRPFSRG